MNGQELANLPGKGNKALVGIFHVIRQRREGDGDIGALWLLQELSGAVGGNAQPLYSQPSPLLYGIINALDILAQQLALFHGEVGSSLHNTIPSAKYSDHIMNKKPLYIRLSL